MAITFDFEKEFRIKHQINLVEKEILQHRSTKEPFGTFLYFLDGFKNISFDWEDPCHNDGSTLRKYVWMPNDVCQKYLDATTSEEKHAIFAESIIPKKDIELVMSQTDASFFKALEALVAEKGDIVNAIMLLQD